MECKHNEQKELLFYNRVEDRLDSKGTRANPKFVYLRCAGNSSQRDGIGRPGKQIVGSATTGEWWSGVWGADERWRGVGGVGEWHSKPDLWRIVGRTAG